MFYKIKTFFNPIYYHGENKNNFFEGWYYKITFNNVNIAFIPGISKHKSNSYAFIQIIDSQNKKSKFIKYKIEDFYYNKNKFEIKIKNNYFSKNSMKLDIDKYYIDISFDELIKPIKNLFFPGVMGPFSYIPNMECNHGIITMNSNFKGYINGEYKKGKIYIEKDWGKSFPKAWIWSQGFSKELSYSISVAKIPFMNFIFDGFLIFIYYNGKIYKFTTYNSSKIEYIKNTHGLELLIKKKKLSLKFTVFINNSSILKAPELGEMKNHINESVDSNSYLELKYKNKLLFSEDFKNTALEIENLQQLLS